MECITGIGKQCLVNYNCDCAYANEIVVLAEGLDMFSEKDILHTIKIHSNISIHRPDDHISRNM
jgi:hypothetical protein